MSFEKSIICIVLMGLVVVNARSQGKTLNGGLSKLPGEWNVVAYSNDSKIPINARCWTIDITKLSQGKFEAHSSFLDVHTKKNVVATATADVSHKDNSENELDVTVKYEGKDYCFQLEVISDSYLNTLDLVFQTGKQNQHESAFTLYLSDENGAGDGDTEGFHNSELHIVDHKNCIYRKKKSQSSSQGHVPCIQISIFLYSIFYYIYFL